MKKVIILHPSKLSYRWIKYLCIDALIEKKVEMEYWDCSAIDSLPLYSMDNIERTYLRKIRSLNDLKKKMSEQDRNKCIYVDMLHRTLADYKIQRIILKYGKFRVNINFCSTELLVIGLLGHQKYKVKDIIPWIIKKLLYTVLYKTSPSSYTINSGKAFPASFKINHPDYESYMELQNSDNRLLKNQYIVFIDSCYPYHPEHIEENPDLQIGIDQVFSEYLDSLNRFFQKIEKEYGWEVVVAGHPVSKLVSSQIGNRRIIYNNSGNLIKYSEGVMLHNSNAISMAVLFDKPILFLTSDRLQQSIRFNIKISNWASFFGLDVINIDHLAPTHSIKLARAESRNRFSFIEDYLIRSKGIYKSNLESFFEIYQEI